MHSEYFLLQLRDTNGRIEKDGVHPSVPSVPSGGAVGAGVVGPGIDMLAGQGLDEAYGLAIGLGRVQVGRRVPPPRAAKSLER